jgi:hypothetical protein
MPKGKKVAPKAATKANAATISYPYCRDAYGQQVLVHVVAASEPEFKATLVGHDPYTGMLVFDAPNGRAFYPAHAVSFRCSTAPDKTEPEPEPEPSPKATSRRSAKQCSVWSKSGIRCVLPEGHEGKHRLT